MWVGSPGLCRSSPPSVCLGVTKNPLSYVEEGRGAGSTLVVLASVGSSDIVCDCGVLQSVGGLILDDVDRDCIPVGWGRVWSVEGGRGGFLGGVLSRIVFAVLLKGRKFRRGRMQAPLLADERE